MSWPMVKLRKLVVANYGKALKKEVRDENGDIKVFGSAGLVGFHNESLFEQQTIVIGRKGSVGKVIWAPKGGWVIDTAYYLTVKENVVLDWRYLFYVLQNVRLDSKTITTSIPGLNRDDFYDTEIPLPPIEQQKRIAAILDKADAIRQKRKQAIALADEFLHSVFLEMFGDPVTNPKGWEVKEVSTVCTEIVDCVNRTAPTVDYETPYKMIRTTNVRDKKINLSETRYVEFETYKTWVRRLKPQKGDLIFTREAPAGEAGVIETDDFIFLGQRTMHFRPNQTLIHPVFLLHELTASGVKRQIVKLSAGSTVTHLSVPECKKFLIRVPNIEKQLSFVKIARELEKQINRSSEFFRESEVFFNALSQKAFSGQL